MDGSFRFLVVDEIQPVITFFAGTGNGSIHPPKINERNADFATTMGGTESQTQFASSCAQT